MSSRAVTREAPKAGSPMESPITGEFLSISVYAGMASSGVCGRSGTDDSSKKGRCPGIALFHCPSPASFNSDEALS